MLEIHSHIKIDITYNDVYRMICLLRYISMHELTMFCLLYLKVNFFSFSVRFINARRRIVQPMIDASNRAGKSPVVTVFKSPRRRGGKNGSQGIPSPSRFGPSGPGHLTPPGYYPEHAQMHPNYHMPEPVSGQSPHFSPRGYIPGGEPSPGGMPGHLGSSPVPHSMHAQMQAAHAYRAQVPTGQGHSQAMYIPSHQMIMTPAGHAHAQFPPSHGQVLTPSHQSSSPSLLPPDTMTQQVVDIHSS